MISKGICQEDKRAIILGAAIFILALCVRIIYFFQLKSSPFFYYIGNKLDPQIYYEWALRIAQGDWFDKDIFIGMPLYAYFLGMIFLVFGKNIAAAIFFRLLLSSVNCLLVFLIAKKLFSIGVAVVAGIIAVLYLPFLFNDAMLTSSVVVTTLNYLALGLLILFEKKNLFSLLVAAGAVLGLATLARANTVLFLPCVILWLVFAFRTFSLAKRFLFAVTVSLSMLVVILPITIRNYIVTGEKVLITSYGGINFYIGNNPGATGLFSLPKGVRSDSLGMIEDFRKIAEGLTGKKMTLTEASHFWTRNTLGLIRLEPIKFIKLMFRKFFYFWNGFEIPDVMDYYFMKRYVGILRWPLFSFVLIGPLSLLGLVLSFQRRNTLFLPYAFMISYMVSILLFFIHARYRLAIVPSLIIFAAFGLDWIFNKLAKKDYRPLLRYVFLFVVFFIFVNAAPQKINYAICYNNLGLALLEQGHQEEAKTAFFKAIEINPNYSDATNNLGYIYLLQKEKEKARQFFQRALRLSPGSPVYLENIKRVSGYSLTSQIGSSDRF